MLELALTKELGRLALDLSLELASGETLVVAGESGAGKTTLLRLVAGLERPDSGRIAVDGQCWFDATRGLDVPAWQRSVGFVPQDYALFPHLTVAENVGFGLRAQGGDRGAAMRRAAAALDQLGVADLARARPGELSGGQQQRVALARAVVLEPALLLLDEPLSALDLRTRDVVRRELRRALESLPCMTIYVTHTPGEALILGDRIAVLEEGRVAQLGDRADFLRFPRSGYLAAFLGTNLLRGRVMGSQAAGAMRVSTPWGELDGIGGGEKGGDLLVRIDPGAVVVDREQPPGSAINVLRGAVMEIVPLPPAGKRVRIRIAAEPSLVAEVSAEAASGLSEGDVVWASFAVSDVECYR